MSSLRNSPEGRLRYANMLGTPMIASDPPLSLSLSLRTPRCLCSVSPTKRDAQTRPAFLYSELFALVHYIPVRDIPHWAARMAGAICYILVFARAWDKLEIVSCWCSCGSDVLYLLAAGRAWPHCPLNLSLVFELACIFKRARLMLAWKNFDWACWVWPFYK